MYLQRVSLPSRGSSSFVKILDERDRDCLTRQVGAINVSTFELLAIAWTALLADSPIDAGKPARVYNKFLYGFVKDPLGLIRRYSGLADSLLRALRSGDSSAEGDCSMPFLKDMMDTPIFREYHQFYRTGDAKLLSFILTFLVFGKKVSYVDPSLDQNAFRDWQKVEARLSSLELPSFTLELRPFLGAFFKDWVADVFLPRHGPGAVSEEKVYGIYAKNKRMHHEPKIGMVYGRDLFFPDEVRLGVFPTSQQGSTEVSPPVTHSRLKFVPKDCNKTRSICMEPVTFQWAQQGVRLWYERSIARGMLHRHVDLHDQTVNQRAATFGSRTHRVDTIDLSSASDSVSWQLVRKIFPAKVLKHLVATRTRRVKTPRGATIEVNKYAPMGSALCFPVQSTIYSAVVMYAGYLYRWGHQPGTLSLSEDEVISLYPKTFRTRLSERVPCDDYRLDPFYVYGDDIICDSRITSLVVELLQRLGFEVNVGKSFMGLSDVRESCGIYAYKGEDITPLRFKVKTLAESVSAEAVSGIIDLANRCRDYGFSQCRKHLIQYLLHCQILGVPKQETGVNPILFSDDPLESSAILTDLPRNPHLRVRRWNGTSNGNGTHQRFQRSEVRSLSIGPAETRGLTSQDEVYRYTQWWRSHYYEQEIHRDGEPVVSETLATGIRWRWTAI